VDTGTNWMYRGVDRKVGEGKIF